MSAAAVILFNQARWSYTPPVARRPSFESCFEQMQDGLKGQCNYTNHYYNAGALSRMFCCKGSWCYSMKHCGNELSRLLTIGFAGEALLRKTRWTMSLELGIDETMKRPFYETVRIDAIVRSRGLAFVVIPA